MEPKQANYKYHRGSKWQQKPMNNFTLINLNLDEIESFLKDIRDVKIHLGHNSHMWITVNEIEFAIKVSPQTP